MKKVKVLQELRRWKSYGPWKAGQLVELPDEDAEQAVRLGLAAEIEEEKKEKEEEKPEGRPPLLSLPVKTGGRSWLEVSLWPPDPEAEEKWRRRARISVRRRVMEKEKIEDREVLHLSPSEAVLLGGVLTHVGVRGKELDREAEEEEDEE